MAERGAAVRAPHRAEDKNYTGAPRASGAAGNQTFRIAHGAEIDASQRFGGGGGTLFALLGAGAA